MNAIKGKKRMRKSMVYSILLPNIGVFHRNSGPTWTLRVLEIDAVVVVGVVVVMGMASSSDWNPRQWIRVI
jgi:hypothetical protein